uniref:Chitin-binding type-2 domain-containing protein n=1 Tax=Setaria digitata TaxID=48799 RepID=A0A915PKL1_9BILA
MNGCIETTVKPTQATEHCEIDTTTVVSTTFEPSPTESSEILSTTEIFEPTEDSSGVKCLEASGIFPHPSDCHLFIHCAHGHPYVKQCAMGTFYNVEIGVCDHLDNAPETCK